MKQTKLSKQQKKIIMILGEAYDNSEKLKITGEYGAEHKRRVNRIRLKRKVSNVKYGKPMTNSEIVSISRSLKSLKKRGIIKYPPSYIRPNSKYVDYDSFTLTDKEGLRVYKDLKKTK